MSAPSAVNRRIVLVRRPRGAPRAEDFRLETDAVPAPGAGQLLLRGENFGKLVVTVSEGRGS